MTSVDANIFVIVVNRSLLFYLFIDRINCVFVPLSFEINLRQRIQHFQQTMQDDCQDELKEDVC
jgi:hypothetical protein